LAEFAVAAFAAADFGAEVAAPGFEFADSQDLFAAVCLQVPVFCLQVAVFCLLLAPIYLDVLALFLAVCLHVALVCLDVVREAV
jgi:hypothetical protein